MSDAFDRRVLSTYLEEFMGDFLFEGVSVASLGDDGSSSTLRGVAKQSGTGQQSFAFSRSSGFVYDLPPWGDLEAYTTKVSQTRLRTFPFKVLA